MAIQISGTTVIDNSRNLTNIASIFSCTGIATQAEAQAGTSSTKLMTPQRVAQAIAALSGGSVINRIQRGTTSVQTPGSLPVPSSAPTPTPIPITSVNISKSFVSQGTRGDIKIGVTAPGTRAAATGSAHATLTSSTNISVQAGASYANPTGIANSATVSWEVIEFV